MPASVGGRAAVLRVVLPVLVAGTLVSLSSRGPLAVHGQGLVHDRGAAGAWQALQKLHTTASLLHTTAHPDDEHGGMLARASRGDGTRVSLLTLTRGEAGDNAIGPELFDALGFIRTEELLLANRYYGVDHQYFTAVADYGFSKRLDEALEKWGRDFVLGEVVRVIRLERPLVIVSRFQGTDRDGHGNHVAAGVVTREAFEAAGDAARFPEQMAEGLRPWQPLKAYIGGVREDEPWHVRIDSGEYSPWFGDSFANLARLGLSFQRSQTGGRYVRQDGPVINYYRRVGSIVEAPDREGGFFDGIDTSIPGLFAALRRPTPAGALPMLAAIDQEVRAAVAAFSPGDPSASAPHLARGLQATRTAARALADVEPDAALVLERKAAQFADALEAALGLSLSAWASPESAADAAGTASPFAPPPVMGPVVPGQRFIVDVALTNRSPIAIVPREISLETASGWKVRPDAAPLAPIVGNQSVSRRFVVALGEEVDITRPHFGRGSIREARHSVPARAYRHLPWAPPPAMAVARYSVEDVEVDVRVPVRRREAHLPYGYESRVLTVVPAVGVRLLPETAVVPLSAARKVAVFDVEVESNVDGQTKGEVVLGLPRDWTSIPASHAFSFRRAGERAAFRFEVDAGPITARGGRVEAVARVGDREYTEGYQVVAHRDLETRYLYRMSESSVRGVDVQLPEGLSVGYVMGAGDQVPAGIAQLGAAVTLLDANDLATGDLSRFDAIVTGTRAYAVRADLRTHNRRLLDYVERGGNLIVLYNTQEYDPAVFAPHPGELTARAEEVSEEDAPVELLAPSHRVLTWPNAITQADFTGWVEQRGSKFWSSWDEAYVPIVAANDTGQAPQRGGWLHVRHGKGHYTYFAYALHRQLPYGVAGAYRLLANLLALNQRGQEP